jgi:hypothetical protein
MMRLRSRNMNVFASAYSVESRPWISWCCVTLQRRSFLIPAQNSQGGAPFGSEIPTLRQQLHGPTKNSEEAAFFPFNRQFVFGSR